MALAGLVGFNAAALFISAEEKGPSKEDLTFFDEKVKPILINQCYDCHSAKAKKVKGKLKLDTKEDFEKGGENGKIVDGTDPEKSMMIKAVRWMDEDIKMPPKKKLADAEIKTLEEWVKRGAPYPATKK
jgi:hypothetical protein